jgi:thioredoxin-dependent peroxiredoxin
MQLARFAVPLAAALALGVPAARGSAQTPAQPLAVGTAAPDFTLPGATRYGVLANPITLSEFRGKTVVLAFFFRARTRG